MESAQTELGNLVVSRKAGEQVFIGSDITITFIAVRGGIARLSIRAPKDVLVKRDDMRGG